jgi:PhzF family phenazine biosynthesis protein
MRYLHLDVFTSSPFEGNQLAVCPEPAPGLTTERMQAIAAEMAFSETTFVFPREQQGDGGGGGGAPGGAGGRGGRRRAA